ncbi:nuclear exosome regulator NRDE2-like [Amphibalanus amphitrite]|uniref:nuclear exosome regulator NRDE2-like n=1 Tax=Amphibalanus amphitrite TaxID=1232801 RepID=UPI001C9279B7|nr:nuclear exosome regulator NRDE2-like [Amphibalanus amphitrite]XP_043210233.1 nuclear exosome regulator NRDE2-like [Amphibalanus amphitrite]
MSLFPAYSADVQEKDESKEKDDQAWLANGSFQPGESHITSAASVTKYSSSQGSPVCSALIPDTTCATSQVPDDSTAKRSPPRAEKHRRKHKRQRSRSRSRSPSKSRHKRHKKRRRREEHSSPPPAPAESPPLKGVFLEDAGVRPESAFSVDRRPDRAARAFPEMYHHHVARYVRRLAGVLGRPRRDRRSVASVARYHDRHWRRRLRRVASNTLPLATLPMGHSFVTLSVRAVSPPPESASDGSDYLRSVRAECPLGPPDRDTAELNRLVSERPGDASLWLQLLEARRRRLAGCVTSQQLLDGQLAVLERALRHCAGSVELRLRRLELRQPDQPPEEARTEWRQLLFSHPAELGVWRRYLASQQHCPGFTVSGLVSAHARCLEKMRQFQADAARPHRPPQGLEEFMLEVVGHICRILRQAGYTERAIAIYQALLELNLFSPPLEGAAGTPASFEPFWDSRLPRVGEPNARGWPTELALRTNGRGAEVEEPDDETELELLSSGKPRAEVWRAAEAGRAARHWLPWDRPGQEDDCEDTDRIVLFEDVRGFLFRVAPERRVRLVEDFVTFLCGDESHTMASEDDDTLRMLAAGVEKLLPSPELPPLSEKMDSPEEPLTMPPLGPNLDSPEYAAFVDRVLEQTATAMSGEHRTRLLQHRLRIIARRAARLSAKTTTTAAAAGAVKEARKKMKAILKSERHSVPLFIEYAQFERSTGAVESSARVLQTALSQCGADDPIRFELVHRWCLVLSSGPNPSDGCRAALSALFSGEVTSLQPGVTPPAHHLARTVSRLRRLLPELTSLAAGGRPPPTVVFVTCCLSWCQLVTAGMQEAAEVFTAVLGDLGKNRSRETDRVTADLHRACCRLLAAARPLADPLNWQSHLQRALRAALARLPLDVELTALAARHCPVPWRQRLSASADSDPPLLSLLRATGEVAHLSPNPPPAEPPSPASPTPAAVAARLRRRLARLVEQPRLQHWLPLWLLYLELELRTGGKDLEAVCYRAIQACPWSKQVHLYLSRTHLRRACDLMARSGLRLRLPLEELDVLLEEEPEMKEEEEEEEERREEGKRERESGTDSGTGSESESESGEEGEGSEGEDSGPGTPSPPPP